ncbi:MAG TPA: hypothetical protein VGA97_10625 [Acidimicrobiia bacterium]
MAVNPDPKPGRWILPLVILGMVAFTYFFVRELPAASPDTTLAGDVTTTTGPPDGSSTSAPPGPTDPEVVAYVDQVEAINDALQLLQTELVTVNTGFDADPKQVQYDEAETRFEAVDTQTAALVTQFSELTVPEGLQNNHDVLLTEIEFAGLAAGDALAGLRSDDPGTLRRNAVEGYVSAAESFDAEVANLRTAAGVSA